MRLQPGDDEELLDQPTEPLALALGRLEERTLLLDVEVSRQLEQRLHVALDGGERRPELVRDDRDEVVLQTVRLPEMLQGVLQPRDEARVLERRARAPVHSGDRDDDQRHEVRAAVGGDHEDRRERDERCGRPQLEEEVARDVAERRLPVGKPDRHPDEELVDDEEREAGRRDGREVRDRNVVGGTEQRVDETGRTEREHVLRDVVEGLPDRLVLPEVPDDDAAEQSAPARAGADAA